MDELRHDPNKRFLVVGVLSDADWIVVSQHATRDEEEEIIEAIRPRSPFRRLLIEIYDRTALESTK